MATSKIPTQLARIRNQIENLRLPNSAYAAIGFGETDCSVVIIDSNNSTQHTIPNTAKNPKAIVKHLEQFMKQTNIKIFAAALVGPDSYKAIGSPLWLDLDIVPYIVKDIKPTPDSLYRYALTTRNHFDTKDLVKVKTTDSNEVLVHPLVTKEDYKKLVSPTVWQFLKKQTEDLKKKNATILFINATPQGGGVALMRHALIRLVKELEVDVHWHVLKPDRAVFAITKSKFHNILQGVAPDETMLTKEDENKLSTWSAENAALIKPQIEKASVIVIDDPQPAGLIPHIKQINPKAKIVYRSHIHLDAAAIEKKDSQQAVTWNHIWEKIKNVDIYIAHPVIAFIPNAMLPKTLTMPASTDQLDGLNKPLSPQQMSYYQRLFDKILLESNQTAIDHTRPYIAQIARFDPSKGLPDALDAFLTLRNKLAKNSPHIKPQLILAGHGSIDDPDGTPIYNMIQNLIQDSKFQQIREDIKIARLLHNDQILNAILRNATIALQLSHKEGFEVKVSEALMKGKPVIAYKTGGIPLQITHNKTGFLVTPEDTETVAEHAFELLTNETLYKEISKNAEKSVSPHYYTVHITAKWLWIANQLLENKQLAGNGTPVHDLLDL